MIRSIIHNHGNRRVTDISKIRKDIRVSNAKNKNRAAQAIRYFDAVANEKGISNADLFVEMTKAYYTITKHKPKKLNFRRNKK